jgi:hypothetical protein
MKTKTLAFLTIFCSFLLFGIRIVYGQSNNLSAIGKLDKAEITTQEGQKMQVKALHYENGSLFYKNKNGVSETLSVDQVYKIDKIGNYAFEGFIGGALGGLLGSFAGTLNWDKNPSLKDSKGAFIIGSTIGGGLLGLIWGAATTKTTPIYKNINISLKPLLMPTHGVGYQMNGGSSLCIGFVIPLQKNK